MVSILEVLRKWAPNISTDRICTKPYTIAAKNPSEKPITIETDMMVIIPTTGLHLDSNHYPDPKKFDPERFSEENKGKIPPFTYTPFGVGPRNCIASRFALLEIKALLSKLIYNFEILPNSKTKSPIKLSRKSLTLNVEGGYWLSLKRLWCLKNTF